MSQVLPFREVLDTNKEYSIQGDVYKISSITTLAGLSRGVRIITLAHLILATIINPFYSVVFVVIMINLSLEYVIFFSNPDLV